MLLSAGCLEDGRTEDEYLSDYVRYAPDVGEDAEPDLPAPEPLVFSMRSEVCSTPPPAAPDFVNLRNTGDELLLVHYVQPDCEEVVVKQIHAGSRIGVDVWPGSVHRLRNEVGTFALQIVAGDGPYPDEVDVP